MTLHQALDAFFTQRPGWSRFNLEYAFIRGWENQQRHESGDKHVDLICGSYLANTTERVVYTAGRLARASISGKQE